MDDILDFETGGMLEIWVQLYAITGKDKYAALMERYYRGRLFDPLLKRRGCPHQYACQHHHTGNYRMCPGL